jgi:translation initiation factor IF-2
VREGFECGISLTDFQDLKQGDIIETYDLREIERV